MKQGAGNASCAPPKGKGKAPAKKRVAPPFASPEPELGASSKEQRQPDFGSSTNPVILFSLLEVKSALTAMNARLDSLENNAISSVCNVNNPGPSSASLVVPAPAVPLLPAGVILHRTQGIAVPAPAIGSQFLSLAAAAIPDSLRNQILNRHDVNLVKILLQVLNQLTKDLWTAGTFPFFLRIVIRDCQKL